MQELYQEHTVKSLMEKVNMTYTNTYGLIRRMREKNLITDIKLVRQVGATTNAKRYGLLMDPVEFVRKEREEPPPPPGFFNNPFNLKNAKDLRYENV